MVIQRGQESSPRRGSEAGYTGSAAAGWSDGPWWRQLSEKRDLGAVKGLVEGTKLSKVSAESYATDYFSSRGGVEEAAKLATQTLSESNPTRSSDIFLAIQAISHQAPSEYFSSSSTSKESSSESGITEPDTKTDDRISFAVYLFDPIHNITFHSLTQTIPEKWITWLDNTETSVADASQTGTPEEIKEIIESGGVDPREWVAEWVEEVLGLGIGIVAQRYVAKRMGVGEGGFMRGKARESTVDALAGEVARAGVF